MIHLLVAVRPSKFFDFSTEIENHPHFYRLISSCSFLCPWYYKMSCPWYYKMSDVNDYIQRVRYQLMRWTKLECFVAVKSLNWVRNNAVVCINNCSCRKYVLYYDLLKWRDNQTKLRLHMEYFFLFFWYSNYTSMLQLKVNVR